MIRIYYIIILPLCLFSCQSQQEDQHTIITIGGERDLIPEGIVIHPSEQSFYLTSIHKKKVVRYDEDDQRITTIIDSAQDNYLRGLGIEIFEKQIFALSAENNHSKLHIIDLQSDHIIRTLGVSEDNGTLMNDLAIDSEGTVYITDTNAECIYRTVPPYQELEMFMKDSTIRYPNGITIADDDEHLYVASWSHGIRIINIHYKEVLNKASKETRGIDGVKYYKGQLFGIFNASRDHTEHGFFTIQLTADQTAIKSMKPVLLNHPTFNVPTTFSINKDVAYILANSQLENLDQELNAIKDISTLTPTYILKIPLD